jgi:methionyl-tRNA formyltransferase
MRVIFMGTPDFALPALAALTAAGHDVIAVYTQPPRPAGRGYKERPSPVHLFAVARGIPVRTPRTLKDPGEQRAFASLDAEVAVVVAYGLLLPKPILDAPRHGCINIHASLLPRWRGAAPIQRAILAGDTKTGVTIMRMDEGLDTGPILLQEEMPVAPDATAAILHDALAAQGARLVVAALVRLARGELQATPQPADGVAYAPKLAREEARLDWRKPARALERQVRAFDPWPGSWFELDGERIKVLRAEVVNGRAVVAPGTVIDRRLGVACGEAALRPLIVQRAGGVAMPVDEFLRGRPIAAGVRLA